MPKLKSNANEQAKCTDCGESFYYEGFHIMLQMPATWGSIQQGTAICIRLCPACHFQLTQHLMHHLEGTTYCRILANVGEPVINESK